MRGLHRTGALVRRVVTCRDIRLGVAVDGLLDRGLTRLVGLEVRCGDGKHRFLPFPACEILPDRLAVDSALVLLERELGFTRAAGRSFTSLRGAPVLHRGAAVGTLADLLVTDAGEVRSVVVTGADGRRELEPGPGVAVGNDWLSTAV